MINALRNHIESIVKIDEAFYTILQERSNVSILKKGKQFAKQGDHVKNIGFLLNGIIRIYFLDENGNEWNKAFIEENNFLLSNINYEEKAQVFFESVTECKILIAPIDFFTDSMKNFPEINTLIHHELGKLLQRKTEREVSYFNKMQKNDFFIS